MTKEIIELCNNLWNNEEIILDNDKLESLLKFKFKSIDDFIVWMETKGVIINKRHVDKTPFEVIKEEGVLMLFTYL